LPQQQRQGDDVRDRMIRVRDADGRTRLRSDARGRSRHAPAKRCRSIGAVRASALAIACAGISISCAARSMPALPTASATSLGFSTAALERIAPALAQFVDSGRVGGIYAVIVRDGRIAYERTIGWRDVARREPLRRDDVFRIYSMTKPVVAAGIMRLVDLGRLRLDEPVSKYIPSFAHVQVFAGGTADAPVLEAAASPITIEQLLNHTSGLAYGLTPGPADTIFNRAQLYQASRPLAEFVDLLAAQPLLFQPGTAWSYSSGFDVAGRVIEVASGTTLDRFLDDEIFRPLGMQDTGFRIRPDMRDRLVTVYTPGPDGALAAVPPGGLMAMFEPDARFLWGSGGLLSTPDDFLRFAQMLLDGGTFDGMRILRPETVALMTRNTLPAALTPVSYRSLEDPTYGFGLGLAVKVDTAGATRPGPIGLYRWSGYLGTYFFVDPAHDMIAMVWTQLSPGGAVPLDAAFQRLVYPALAR
jgi:CubicO group peptidase (beta-lactamase class C family)